jgi:hypothetical protein
LSKAKAHGTKSGKPIGCPRIPERKRQQISKAYKAGGISMRALAVRFGALGTVQACLAAA